MTVIKNDDWKEYWISSELRKMKEKEQEEMSKIKNSLEAHPPEAFSLEESDTFFPDYNDGKPVTRTIKTIHKDLESPLFTEEEEEAIKRFYSVSPKSNYIDYTQGSMSFNESDAWIQTYSGRRFSPINPVVDSIVIQDIAHALSMQCRFSGHIHKFYSVAQHSVLVSYICNFEDALWGLLHDASEAYLVDVPSPIKRSSKFAAYVELEKNMTAAICKRFGLPEIEPPSVKRADQLLLATEARDLLKNLREDWIQPYDPLPLKIESLSPQDAKDLFMKRFFELTNSPDGYAHYLADKDQD